MKLPRLLIDETLVHHIGQEEGQILVSILVLLVPSRPGMLAGAPEQ